MAYGLNTRLFIENGPAVFAAGARARSRAAWRALGPERRLQLVDRALTQPANSNLPDGFPAAL